jgi:hypothetical protein
LDQRPFSAAKLEIDSASNHIGDYAAGDVPAIARLGLKKVPRPGFRSGRLVGGDPGKRPIENLDCGRGCGSPAYRHWESLPPFPLLPPIRMSFSWISSG